MDVRKVEFANDVIHIVHDLGEVVFNITTQEQLVNIFGITQEQLETIIKKIINTLPDTIFENLYPQLADEIKNICAREFIFFQVQERWNSPHYQDDLLNFIRVFSRDIQQRVETHNNSESKMKEE